jgi:hypothetical protein
MRPDDGNGGWPETAAMLENPKALLCGGLIGTGSGSLTP